LLERAVILCDGSTLRIEHIDLGPAARPASASQSLAEMEKDHILSVLKQTGGAIAGPAGAAKILGVPPSTLRSRMARLGIKV
jgi:formate hydrogenlyase transcriptional activator